MKMSCPLLCTRDHTGAPGYCAEPVLKKTSLAIISFTATRSKNGMLFFLCRAFTIKTNIILGKTNKMKPPFTSSQEMYNYAANQMINQNLSNETVKKNLMERGVSDADAEIVIQNMLVAIEKNRKAATATNTSATATTTQPIHTPPAANSHGAFASVQDMYNYAANQMIVQKLSNPVVKQNLLANGVTAAQADIVIKNMMEQAQKNKPAQVNAKRSEGKSMMLFGLILVVVGAILVGTNFKIAGDTYAITYGIMAIGAVLFFRGLFKMF